ncbi:MAG: hypothetical protein E7537_03965 [Ruminococcaceae bacterium]|nr:hypothetical protein [Oscillospiraceae bacterium]
MTTSEKILEYINNGWDATTRYNPKDIPNGEKTLYGVPYPYVVPAVGAFEELYYWDTYFANKGLELSDKWDMVKNNTDNILFMIERFGCMKNSNREFHAGVAQPPFSSIMVRDVFEHYGDKTWIFGAYNTLKKEYNFWMSKRITPIGLNQYGGFPTDSTIEAKADAFCKRISGRPEGLTDQEIVDQYMICCESGWDCNPRWDGFYGKKFVQVELNSLLYAFEKNMEYFSEVLELQEENEWHEKAKNRKALMDKFMLNADGFYTDYNFIDDYHSKIMSSSCLFPLYTGLAQKEQAEKLMENLYRIDAPFGITATENNEYVGKYTMQWCYPVGWACQQHIAIKALDNYGYKDKAKEVAQKYISLTEKVFEETGQLWEKYNVVEGSNQVLSHGRTTAMPPMIGWTAATYLTSKKYLETGKIT